MFRILQGDEVIMKIRTPAQMEEHAVFLRANMWEHGSAWCAIQLGVSTQAIANQANKMKLKTSPAIKMEATKKGGQTRGRQQSEAKLKRDESQVKRFPAYDEWMGRGRKA